MISNENCLRVLPKDPMQYFDQTFTLRSIFKHHASFPRLCFSERHMLGYVRRRNATITMFPSHPGIHPSSYALKGRRKVKQAKTQSFWSKLETRCKKKATFSEISSSFLILYSSPFPQQLLVQFLYSKQLSNMVCIVLNEWFQCQFFGRHFLV